MSLSESLIDMPWLRQIQLLSVVSPWCEDHHLCRNGYPDSKVRGDNMGPIWGRQGPGGPMLAPWTLLSGYILILRDTMGVSLKDCAPDKMVTILQTTFEECCSRSRYEGRGQVPISCIPQIYAPALDTYFCFNKPASHRYMPLPLIPTSASTSLYPTDTCPSPWYLLLLQQACIP